MFSKLSDLFSLKSFYNTLNDNDLVSKQRFRLFKITTAFSFIVFLAFVYQAAMVLDGRHFTLGLIVILFLLLFINYFAISKHQNQKIAYLSLVLILFTLLHVVTYYQGGVRNSGMFYLAGIILIAYMLLGNKGGKLMAALSIVHIGFFFYANRYTNWISYDFIGDSDFLIDLDFLITATISILVVTAQSNYIEKSKNAIIQDILEKKEELKKLSLVASKTNNGVVITDQFGKAEYVNEGFERLMGFSESEVIGRKPADLLHGEETDQNEVDRINKILAKGESVSAELIKYRKNGSKIWIQESITPIIENGKLEKYIYIESDITPRKDAEQRMNEYMINLERTNRELDKFAYVVSHDLKAPLRAIGNLTGWIEEDLGDNAPEGVVANFNIIKGRVIRMEALINGILDYSKAAKKAGVEETFDTRNVIHDAFDLIGASNECKLILGEKLPIVHTEKTKLQQIFLNLINNAIKFNDKKVKVVEVDAEESKHFWHFYVKDNGPGIDKKFHEKIFVIFQTLNARDEFESTGIGLAIVKKIVEDQGGRIWVESEPGNGSVFHFTWPKSPVRNFEDISKAEFVPA
ncbi:MAG: PAS domain S-box protein [Bacteroidia bacterium]|nr:PAS domain S-box protein [Bacteroidia bacterium]